MESELNRKIREILEMFDIETEYPKAKVVGKWSLIGHLANLFNEELGSQKQSIEKKVEQLMLDKILYIGDEIPEYLTKDKRTKFILLGSPQEFLDSLARDQGEGEKK